MHKKIIATLSIGVLVLSSFVVASQANAAPAPGIGLTADDIASSIVVDTKGAVKVTGMRVMQLAGPTLYTRVYWGDSFLRILVKGGTQTMVTKRYGEQAALSDVAVNDYIEVTGNLESSSEALVIIPKTIKDLSLQTEQTNFSGSISSISDAKDSFTLNTTKNGTVLVNVDTSTQIKLGNRYVTMKNLKVGDVVTNINGIFDHAARTLDAKQIIVYLDLNQFKSQNFQGTLKSTPTSATTPTTFVMTINGKDYTVNLSNDNPVYGNKRNVVLLSRFVVGDTLRIFGAIQETDEPIINAVLVRNLNI